MSVSSLQQTTVTLAPGLLDRLSVGERATKLHDCATRIRRSVIAMIGQARMGHIGGDLSVADILTTLFFAVLKLDPGEPCAVARDRFILRKVHWTAALYATAAHRGFMALEVLATVTQPLPALNGHPNRRKVPGVEANTGPLGHGLPIGVGCAIAAKLARASWRTYVALGDGELQEGPNWEAAMCAGRRGLDTLVADVDRNRLQQGAPMKDTKRLEPLGDKWRVLGWDVVQCDGHDHAALYDAFVLPHDVRPRCVIARTIKGKGVSFIEDRVAYHHKVPSPVEIELAGSDERIVAVCNDSAGSSNLTGFQTQFPERLINAGIAEQNIVGVAAGLANVGFIPFICAAAPFPTGSALEQVKVDVAYNALTVVLRGMSPDVAYGELEPTHLSSENFSWLRAIDGLALIALADPAQTAACLRWAGAAATPCCLRIGRGKAPSATADPAKALSFLCECLASRASRRQD